MTMTANQTVDTALHEIHVLLAEPLDGNVVV